jgi:hypothetical protein
MAVTFPEPIIISAEVMKGYMVVMGASVEATVSRPQAAPMTVTLLDNGVGKLVLLTCSCDIKPTEYCFW